MRQIKRYQHANVTGRKGLVTNLTIMIDSHAEAINKKRIIPLEYQNHLLNKTDVILKLTVKKY